MSELFSVAEGYVDDDVALATTSHDKVVLMFSGSRCPPCKKLYPIFNQLAATLPDIKFIKLDVEEFGKASADFGITCMPTFLFYCQGACVGKIEGGSANLLQTSCASLNAKEIGKGISVLQKYAPKTI